MVELFQQGIPAQESPIRSAEIRNNFEALYERLKVLEPRATTPIGTSVLVEGGSTFFRSGSSVLYNDVGEAVSGRLQFIDFKATLINLATASGFKTIKNSNGTLSREAITGGVSPFTQQGVYREVLISLNSLNKLTFTEGATTTTGLSRPFDIGIDDSEIPIALVMIQQSGSLGISGQLKSIEQINIKDVRPIITTAFQNNLTAAEQQVTLEDNTKRITSVEQSLKITDTLRVRIPLIEKLEIDGTNKTNTRLEVLSGQTYIDNKLVKFPGALVEITQDLSTPIPVSNFNKVVVTLSDSGLIELIHGTSSDSNSDPADVLLPQEVDDGYLDSGVHNGILTHLSDSVPLAIVSYRMISGVGTTSTIEPIVSEVFVDATFDTNDDVNGGIRFSYAFDMVSINSAQEFVVNIPADVDEADVFLTGQDIDLYDDNTRSFRRTISNNPQGTFNSTTRNMTIQVLETFVNEVTSPNAVNGISLQRNPKVVALNNHLQVIEDVRPFVV